jgi:hypothetical protein
MPTLPNSTVIVGNGNLGRVAPSEDGITLILASGVSVSGKFALGDVLGPFFSLDDAEAMGITSKYDDTNTCMAWKQISDFYSEAGNGTEVYVQVLAKTVTMADMATINGSYLAVVLPLLGAKIRLVILSRTPQTGYTPVITAQLEADVTNAIIKAQELVDYEQTKNRRISVFIEGRNWGGTASSSLNLRDADAGPNANRVSLIIGNDYDYATSQTYRNQYASVGLLGGRAAKGPVNRNVGRIKSGKLKITNPGLSNGAKIQTLGDTNEETLNAKGYIYIKAVFPNPGFYFNDDHCACVITDDYAFVSHGRTIDKAARICQAVFAREINDEVYVEVETGKLPAATVKNYQGLVETNINSNMAGEMSGASAFCDPNQNVLSTDKIKTKVSIIKTGTSRILETELGFDNPFLNN